MGAGLANDRTDDELDSQQPRPRRRASNGPLQGRPPCRRSSAARHFRARRFLTARIQRPMGTLAARRAGSTRWDIGLFQHGGGTGRHRGRSGPGLGHCRRRRRPSGFEANLRLRKITDNRSNRAASSQCRSAGDVALVCETPRGARIRPGTSPSGSFRTVARRGRG